MTLLTLSYISLCITAASGLLLFFGYTFRARRHLLSMYPLLAVRIHVVLVLITAVLLSIFFVEKVKQSHPFTQYQMIFFTASFALFVATLITGLYFHFRFDSKKIRIQGNFLVLHWILAVLTFIFLTSSIIIYHASENSFSKYYSKLINQSFPPIIFLHKEMRELYLKEQRK